MSIVSSVETSSRNPPIVDETSPYWREEMQRGHLHFYLQARRECGNVVEIRHLHTRWFLLNNPDDIETVLKSSYRQFRKGFLWDNFRLLVGQGLVTVEPEHWLKQRRALQPVFLRRYHERFANRIGQSVQNAIERYRAKAASGETVAMTTEMARLTLGNASHTLFGTELGDLNETISENLSSVIGYIALWHQYPWHKKTFGVYLPHTSHARFRRSMKVLERSVQTIVERRETLRLSNDDEPQDLLRALLEDENEPPHGSVRSFGNRSRRALSNLATRGVRRRRYARMMRDQVMSFVFVGHETTAAAVCWVWYLLSQHPKVEAKLHQELDRVLDGRAPSREDLPNLPYLSQVLNETLRLYPPVWGFSRETTQTEKLSGYTVPAGSTLNIVPYVMHRHPDFWDEPEKFDPERFAPEREAGRHPFAYIPFGAGPRQCIGKHTALLEAQLVVAGIAQHFTLRLAPDVDIQPIPSLTLWPSANLPMTFHPRQPQS